MIRNILLSAFVAVGMSSCTVAALVAAPGVSHALDTPPAVAGAR